MYYNKIAAILIMISCWGTIHAWTDEVAIGENETMDINWNPSVNGSTVENPYKYSDDDITYESFTSSTLISTHQQTINFAYIIYKQVYNPTLGTYVQTDCNITIETSVTLSYNSETNMFEIPNNWDEQISNGYMVKKYFQDLINSDSQYCSEFNTTDESDNPDVFYTAIDIDVGDGDTYEGEMYVSIDDRDAQELANEETPYGYAMTGRGSEGGAGSIYSKLNMYDEGEDGSGMGSVFQTFFYCFIPFIFIIAVYKLILKIQHG